MISDAVYEHALAERDAARVEAARAWDFEEKMLKRATAAEARVAELEQALRACRELFVELRGDWSDNRGPCREGFEVIDAVLGAEPPLVKAD